MAANNILKLRYDALFLDLLKLILDTSIYRNIKVYLRFGLSVSHGNAAIYGKHSNQSVKKLLLTKLKFLVRKLKYIKTKFKKCFIK